MHQDLGQRGVGVVRTLARPFVDGGTVQFGHHIGDLEQLVVLSAGLGIGVELPGILPSLKRQDGMEGPVGT